MSGDADLCVSRWVNKSCLDFRLMSEFNLEGKAGMSFEFGV